MAIFNNKVVNDFAKDNGSIIFFEQIEGDESARFTFFSSSELTRAVCKYFSAKVEEYNAKQAQMTRELFFSRSLVGYSGKVVKNGLTSLEIALIALGVVGVGAIEYYTKFFSSTAKGCVSVVKAPFNAMFGDSEEEKQSQQSQASMGLPLDPEVTRNLVATAAKFV